MMRLARLVPIILGIISISSASLAFPPLRPEEAAALRREARDAPLHVQAKILSAQRTATTWGAGCARIKAMVQQVFSKGRSTFRWESLSCFISIVGIQSISPIRISKRSSGVDA